MALSDDVAQVGAATTRSKLVVFIVSPLFLVILPVTVIVYVPT